MKSLGQECQTNGTEYFPAGKKKKKQTTADDENDEYVDLSDDEIVIDDDDDDDLSDLYPGRIFNICSIFIILIIWSYILDFRRLRASDVKARMTQDDENDDKSGTKRKAQKSEVRNETLNNFIFQFTCMI